ncbi:VIT domain-containing protein [Thiohalocapsa marina]|nr:VIT domain-containing protein [Thiohalocapsa marina]
MDQRVTESAPLLTATALRGRLEGLLGEIRIAQTFRNTESVNIEAVFTFPVPPEAVLLGVEVRIDERVLTGAVLPARQAEEDYEEAMVSGDGAILLQRAGRGLYTVNVGNLLPGQTAELDYRYALLGAWDGDLWRLTLPTTVAPRYGDPLRGGLAPHQVPPVALQTGHRFTLELVFGGSLRAAEVDSPSHEFSITPADDGLLVSLAQGSAPLDRDLVLRIRADAVARAGAALYAPDPFPGMAAEPAAVPRSGAVALVSLQPQFESQSQRQLQSRSPTPPEPAGRDYVLIADASGSMAGDSIAQTREALADILERLQPADRFNLIVFGNAPEALFPALQPADARHLSQARAAVARLDADRGGTEIGAALRLAHRQRPDQSRHQPLDLLLITDGETWDVEGLITAAKAAGDRVFTVGVGAAVAEGLVRGLAEATGGACVLVHPNERMAEQILRQFERMRAPRATLAIAWPAEPLWQWPAQDEPLFAGDTLHRLAGFTDLPEGSAALTFTLADGRTQTASLALEPWPAAAADDTLPRLAAARRLTDLGEEEATDLAVAYQLVTPHTHFLLRDVRDEATKAGSLPELRQVAHQLAAGWGGMGTLDAASLSIQSPSPQRSARAGCVMYSRLLPDAVDDAMDWSDVPRFLRRSQPRSFADTDNSLAGAPPAASVESGLDLFADWLRDQLSNFDDPHRALPTLEDLAGAGLPEALQARLAAMVDAGAQEEAVVATLLLAVLAERADLPFARETRRRLRFAVKQGLSETDAAAIRSAVAAWCAGDST